MQHRNNMAIKDKFLSTIIFPYQPRFFQGRARINCCIMQKLFINTFLQLPYSLDWQTLKKHFQQVGDVRFAEIKMEGGKSAGWGLICFRKEEDAQRAISKLM